MKILAIYRHYWPDTTPYARLLRSILEQLAADGHDVSVYTSQPSYNDLDHQRQPRHEKLGGVDVMRIGLLPERKRFKLLRAVNFAWFLVRSVVHAVACRRYGIIIANGHPPVMMGVALRCIKAFTGTHFVLHLQDIHPESALTAGQLKPGWLTRRLLKQDIANCAAAKCIVTLSEDMRATLVDRDGGRLKAADIRTINNFPLDVYHRVDESELPKLLQGDGIEEYRVLFAGNLGHFQKLERLVDAAKLLSDHKQIRFIFMGAGAVRRALEKQAGALVGRTVFFEPYQPVEVAVECMRRCDLGVISLAPDVYRVAYPSKTMTYLSAGLPVLGIVERQSNVAAELADNDFGYLPNSTSPADIAVAIEQACEHRGRWTDGAREELIERSETHFGREQAMEAWTCLLREFDSNDGAAPPEGSAASQRQAA